MKEKKINLSKPLTLRSLRESVGITQKEITQRTRISQSVLSKYERGERRPTFDKAVALAREYNVSLKTLAKAMHIDVEGVPDKDNISD